MVLTPFISIHFREVTGEALTQRRTQILGSFASSTMSDNINNVFRHNK